MWYTILMRITRTQNILFLSLAGALLLTGVYFIGEPAQLTGKVLDADSFLLTQYKSDFDRDSDIDFLDFTVFSSFYNEEN